MSVLAPALRRPRAASPLSAQDTKKEIQKYQQMIADG